MNEPRIDNKMLDLLYGESDEEARRRALDEMDSGDKETLEELEELRSAFSDLTADDELGSVARANILREARLTAADRKEKREKAAAFPWFPAFALGALALMIGVGTYFFLYRPPSVEPGQEKRSDEVVATGTQPAEDEMARNVESPEQAKPEETSPSELANEREAKAPANSQEKDKADAAATDLVKESDGDSGQGSMDRQVRDRDQNTRVAEAPKKSPATAAPDLNQKQEKAQSPPQSVATNRANSATSGAASGSGDYGAELDDLGNDATSLQRGVALYQSGNYNDAVATLTDALSAGTDRKTALYYRGLAQQKLSKHIDAIADFREVVEKHSSWARAPEAELALADSMVAVGNPTGAAEHYQAVADGGSGQADTARERMKNLQTTPGGGLDQDGSKATARDKDKKKRSRKKSTDKSKEKKRSMEKDDMMAPAESKGSIVY